MLVQLYKSYNNILQRQYLVTYVWVRAISNTDYKILDLFVICVQEHSWIRTSYRPDRAFNTFGISDDR